jgi:hypothetical protein
VNARERLVTHVDLHMTMSHVLNFGSKQWSGRFGQSLFNQIPRTRTCADVGIPMVYCGCVDMTPVNSRYVGWSNQTIRSDII